MKIKSIFISFIFIGFFACNDSEKPLSLEGEYADNQTNIKKTDLEADSVRNQDLKYSLEQLDNTKGLSNSSVNCIFQDSQNLLWIGTWDGLNRYDGSNFKIFRSEQDNKKSLSNQVILKVGEDKEGQIWVLTMHGINRYNKKTDTFEHYYFSRKNNPPLSESEFNMALDASKQVFCAVKDWGIGYFDGKEFQSIESKEFSAKTVRKMEFSANGKLLVLFDDNELYSVHFSTENGKKSIAKTELVANNVKTFEVLPNQDICTVFTSGAVELYYSNYKSKAIFPQKNIENIVGHLPEGLVLSGKSGYSIVNFEGNTIVKPWSKYLKNQKITTLIQGSENIIWTGTDGDGVFKMYPLKKSFNLISKAQMPELDGGIVRTFLEVDGNSFWVGTKGKGLFRFSSDFYLNPEKSLDYQNFNESNSIINNAVFALSEGKDNLVFIGTDGDGIAVYDVNNSKLISWRDIEGSEKAGYFKSIYAIHQDKNGFIWLGTNGYGMIRCKITRSGSKLKVTDFQNYIAGNKGENSLSSNIIFSIVPRNDNQLWIGTRLGGLNLFDKSTGKFQIYKNDANNPESLSNNDILCLVTDANNKLWIGTSFGLNVLEELKNDGKAIFKTYTAKDGLPNNTIHGIVSDKKSNLWISTNFGLSNFSINPEKFINYTRNEGLQNNEFADGAFYNDPESDFIFMGGIKGFNYFLPQKIKESAVVPDLLIDKISGQNQAIPYYQGLVISPDSKTYPSIVLKHNQNFFDIQLASLTYINNEKCQYAYQLEGFDQDWNSIDNRKIISFTNVPRGNYSLWLKWTNSDGVWSEPVQAIDIRVKPVFWQSNVALLVYAILLVSFLLFVRSYYLKRQSLKQNILIRQNEEVLHENRLTFFTNIAHEFLTPLTLIVGPIQKLSETTNLNEKNQKFIHMIQRNSSRLLFLTQQLLEFRKAEYDYLENTVKKFDLVNLVEQIAELFDDWALDKNIDYHVEVPSTLPGWFDKDKLEKIVFNLMSNAFKYTPSKGNIHLKFKIEDKNFKTLNITITNSGKGIPKEKLESLFDRFFLSDTNQTSDTEMFRTGIGLAYIKKLVTVLRGEIQVSSIPNEQTTFTILIPCEKEAFTEKEIDMEKSPVLISHHLKNILEEITEKADDIPDKISALDNIENNQKKILIVEDEKEIHLFLNDLLADKYKIITAYNGVEALESIENELPDIIISDVMMPLMDGVELCKRVKTDLRTCHIPFIMLTAKDSVIHRIEGLESGANSYIPKPFYPDHLLVRVQKLLEEKELILQHFTQDAVVGTLSDIPINNEEKAFIKQVIDLIRKNIDNENLQSSFLEKTLGISTSQLYRKTKEIFGLSPGDLIRTIRLKHSAELLRRNQLTVSEVCYASGFNNRSYFYREFKKVYNTTPKNYQLQYKSKNSSFSNN
ncbi:signal transduction histidine kinase/DNA-binding response OmpR family regulator/ligand-binding sensor domain-containing protein [Flavobacterium arsenatis]|uniref:histidine kinase n=1 Tax=Flavobacterium arsenatis TaxID=1484332 RepID=A0ABU1TQQ4_9FLAO|nr:two-component regulator propeller domain-containing protein [Flavobacterium arsenatis]MDR6968310.1 signal transduction histidine kinase/DNA-binding response OmpR family regulator/ligand-binding sensor domain-containing protein [Flavobacterium arsenatis]